jgi:hypothetical protein
VPDFEEKQAEHDSEEKTRDPPFLRRERAVGVTESIHDRLPAQ